MLVTPGPKRIGVDENLKKILSIWKSVRLNNDVWSSVFSKHPNEISNEESVSKLECDLDCVSEIDFKLSPAFVVIRVKLKGFASALWKLQPFLKISVITHRKNSNICGVINHYILSYFFFNSYYCSVQCQMTPSFLLIFMSNPLMPAIIVTVIFFFSSLQQTVLSKGKPVRNIKATQMQRCQQPPPPHFDPDPPISTVRSSL